VISVITETSSRYNLLKLRLPFYLVEIIELLCVTGKYAICKTFQE
jgi:hypothetical protein